MIIEAPSCLLNVPHRERSCGEKLGERMRDAMISGWTQRLLSLLPVRTRSNAKLAREEQIAGRPRLPWPLRLFLLPIRTRHPDTSSSSVSHRIRTLGVCEYSFEWNSGCFTTDATESERTNYTLPVPPLLFLLFNRKRRIFRFDISSMVASMYRRLVSFTYISSTGKRRGLLHRVTYE